MYGNIASKNMQRLSRTLFSIVDQLFIKLYYIMFHVIFKCTYFYRHNTVFHDPMFSGSTITDNSKACIVTMSGMLVGFTDMTL
jgi:hypothetical protein